MGMNHWQMERLAELHRNELQAAAHNHVRAHAEQVRRHPFTNRRVQATAFTGGVLVRLGTRLVDAAGLAEAESAAVGRWQANPRTQG